MFKKRLFDLFLIILSLPALLPTYLLLVLLLLVFQGTPIHYSQTRVGRNGVPFRLYKFRSMVVNADKSGAHNTQKNDLRITRIGGIFRKLSLDEIPQLINVIKNDMSLIGPRPNLPRQKEDFTDADWNKRHRVPPGLTGLAQVSGRSALSQEDRLRLDLAYVDRHSLLLDIKILIDTVKIVILRKGTN